MMPAKVEIQKLSSSVESRIKIKYTETSGDNNALNGFAWLANKKMAIEIINKIFGFMKIWQFLIFIKVNGITKNYQLKNKW